MIRLVLASVLLTSIALTGFSCSRADTEPRPNILMIVADDNNFSDFGFMDSKVALTPHIDRLAETGVVFTHGFNTASVCKPSLESILTGTYPMQLRKMWTRRWKEKRELPDVRMFETLATIPRLLARRGYLSAMAGKYWGEDPANAGFTESIGNDSPGAFFATTSLGRPSIDPVFDFIDRQDKPWFLFFAPMLPHVPFDAPEEFRNLYNPDDFENKLARGYYANVTRFDDVVGRLLGFLESRELLDDTLIVLLSDNGWNAAGGTGHLAADGPRGKGSIYEDGFRTPIIFNWRRKTREGIKIDDLVSTVDLLPTLVEISGARMSGQTPGRSLAHQILKDSGKQKVENDLQAPNEFNFGMLNSRDPTWYARSRDWRLIRRGPQYELYDMSVDPSESNNLVNTRPHQVNRLRSAFELWYKETVRQIAMLKEIEQLENEPPMLCPNNDPRNVGCDILRASADNETADSQSTTTGEHKTAGP